MKYHPDKNPDAGDKFKEISHVSFFLKNLSDWFIIPVKCSGSAVVTGKNSVKKENEEWLCLRIQILCLFYKNQPLLLRSDLIDKSNKLVQVRLIDGSYHKES